MSTGTVADRRHMAHALRLARRGLGQVWPNPAVGCVLVREGVVVGRGTTQPGGRPHAEAVALAQAGVRAAGATAYVTLEPCAHHGRTGPCADALAAGGVVRVVSAMTDPDPRTCGQGHERLRAAGIEVIEGVGAREAARINRGFVLRVTARRPLVTLKLATSFDGRIATAGGESRWISGEVERHHVHFLRMTHDAIMVGGGTARADNPRLTVRGYGAVRQPLRVVASTRPVSLRSEGGDVVNVDQVARDADGLVLPALMAHLADLGITRVFCEGGGRLAAGLLRADLVDEVVGCTAGVFLGGDARPAIGAMGLEHLADAPRFDLVAAWRIGSDVLHRWRRSEQGRAWGPTAA